MSVFTNVLKKAPKNRSLGLVCFLICISGLVKAQTAFTNANTKLPNQIFYSWLQKGVADMNADGRDDIVRANALGEFFILHQQVDGSFVEKQLGKVQPYTPLSIILADVDNNGFADILTGGQYNGIRVVKANANASAYNITRLPQDSIFTQASALADINNDGWLDAFVCNDDSTNGIWKNTGGGNFIKDAIGFDFSSVPLNKHSGNYGIVFTDFDNDGDLDAYLSKCRAGVTDSTDQRRINQFFVNTNGKYIDQAKKYGMADSSQTWVTEFQDIDNDGDLDAFIANHHTPSRLMLNNGSGFFTDITTSSGLLGKTPDGILQALMRDFDNDGYVDLLVSGMMGAKYFKNKGNRTFEEVALPFLALNIDTPLRSFAIGDLNHDGFQDIYASYHFGGREPDVLWLNDKNTNHFLAVNLTGSVSNRSAVGAKIKLSVGTQTFLREVRAGESYGISNSLTQYVGLGQNTTIDKLEVFWPSGLLTSISNPSINQFLNIIEPTCSNTCISVTITKYE
jgi:ASPIC and UnbV/FG-GAP-like repeat